MSNSFGHSFCITTFGESHSDAVGAVIDGCPARLPLDVADIQACLDRRRPGHTTLSTPRREEDRVSILSGVDQGVTLGSPIALLVRNTNVKPADYIRFQSVPRPSHADFTYRSKYGILAASGGGRASARETVGRVAAGAIAEKWLALTHDISIVAWVSAVGPIEAPDLTERNIIRADVDSTPARCPCPETAAQMIQLIQDTQREKDSVGGCITCVCRQVPVGWGEPVFDKLTALLAHGMLSIPACHGFEIGSGFPGTRLKGSEHNDAFVVKQGRLGTVTNRSGGVQGGISNGEPIVFRVAFKPTATIGRDQTTSDYEGHPTTLAAAGRHDPCVAPRAVPVVEAMAALVLADLALTHGRSQGKTDD